MDIELTASDGTPLAARIFPATEPKGAVLIVSAMGIPQQFYAPFATWLASEQFTVLTFDYRGIGKSRRGPLSKLDARE